MRHLDGTRYARPLDYNAFGMGKAIPAKAEGADDQAPPSFPQ
jgi:hypothetical protein